MEFFARVVLWPAWGILHVIVFPFEVGFSLGGLPDFGFLRLVGVRCKPILEGNSTDY
jgi:hypothetical protein